MKLVDLYNNNLPSIEDLKPFMCQIKTKVKSSKPVCLVEIYNRDNYIKNLYFSIITKELIEDFCNYIGNKKVLEICAGSGLLSKYLYDSGIDIIATDNYSWDDEISYLWANSDHKYYNVIKMDAIDAMNDYPDRDIILLSWPEKGNTIDNNVLNKCVFENKTLILIGEIEGGCTGSTEFFDSVYKLVSKGKIKTNYNLYDYINKDYFINIKFRFTRFQYIHDIVMVFEPVQN